MKKFFLKLLWPLVFAVILVACGDDGSVTENRQDEIANEEDEIPDNPETIVESGVDENGTIHMSFSHRSSSSRNVVQSSSSIAPVEESSSSVIIEPVDESVYDSATHTLKDLRDGKVYRTARIVSQEENYRKVWMTENLNFAYLQKTSEKDSSSLCYDDDPANCEKYGRLYMWSAAMDSASIFSTGCKNCGYGTEILDDEESFRGICPNGWHIPSLLEFMDLVRVESKLAETEREFFLMSRADLLGGMWELGDYDYKNEFGFFWTSSERGTRTASAYYVQLESQSIHFSNLIKSDAASVRCMKDDDFYAPLERDAWYNLNPEISYGLLTDVRDNSVYRTVDVYSPKSGKTQTWMAENLALDYELFATGKTSRNSCYQGELANCERFGRMYTWNQSVDSAGVFSKDAYGCGSGVVCEKKDSVRGICPDGWRLATKDDWRDLLALIVETGGDFSKSLKSTKAWYETTGDDTFGLAFVPNENLGYVGEYWVMDEDGYDYSYSIIIEKNSVNISDSPKSKHEYVRCVKESVY